MLTSEFKPCPFCASTNLTGETAVIPGDLQVQQETNRIICLNCGAQGPNELTKEQALHSWNKRMRDQEFILYPSKN